LLIVLSSLYFQGITRAGTATEFEDYPDDGIRIYEFGYFRVIVALWELRH